MIFNETQPDLKAGSVPQELITAILQVLRAEKIICFGRRIRQTTAWSCFIQDPERQSCVIYDLLIITTPDEKRNRHEILNMIDRINTSTIAVNALVHNIVDVNAALVGGSIFFRTVCEKGLLAYDNRAIPLIVLSGSCSFTEAIHALESSWHKWFGLAKQFLNGATHFSSYGWNNLAAFMLHQAVEDTCLALIRAATGYRATTHNLSRLIEMTGNFTSAFLTIFPRNTQEEVALFHVLARAYSDVRYKEDFEIADATIATLIARVTALQCHAESLYKDRLFQIGMRSTRSITGQ